MDITSVVRAINRKLKETCPEVVIQSKDVKEGYTRPCFYTEVVDYTSERVMADYDHKQAVISILYFPTDPHIYQVELLQIREQLHEAFMDVLEVDGSFVIPVMEVEDTVNDGVLTLDMTLAYYVHHEGADEAKEMMEEVVFDLT